MENYYPKPKWWRLYAIVPVTLTLLVIDSQLALPDLGHKLVEILIVIATVGLMALWVMANALALEYGDAAEQPTTETAGVPRPGVARGRMGVPASLAPIDTETLVSVRNN